MNKQLLIENLQRLIENELMLFTEKTGEVVDDIHVSPHESKLSGDVYYDVDLELL